MKVQIKIELLDDEVIYQYVDRSTREEGLKVARGAARRMLKSGLIHNYNGMRFYPAHMIKVITIK